jgi:hypothetical protein
VAFVTYLIKIARDIALIELNPVDWGGWVGYLLEEMETQAANHRLMNEYEYSLNVLIDKLQNRIKGGKW